MIQKEITDNMGSKRVIPVKRGEWLIGMTRGEDLLTAAKQPLELDPKGGNRLRALGLLGNKFDTVGGDKAGAIFEFREMPKNLRYDQWWPFAQSIFQYMMQLNASQDDEEKPTYRSGVG